ncbi:M23 family metallopeptidase [Allohahella sp. A8]|uniref:M23 family metallopeptidase n=1 Tax=Allohahella sp. A8 TaxID=3141461 RepID=UPI000C0B48E1|nr:hypothetical protein [Hahellaceae bacterium]
MRDNFPRAVPSLPKFSMLRRLCHGVGLTAALLAVQTFNTAIAAERFSYQIKSGDTLAKALNAAGMNGQQAYKVNQALAQHLDLKTIKPGQVVQVERNLEGVNDSSSFRVLLDLGFGGMAEATLVNDVTVSQFAQLVPQIRTVSVEFTVSGSVIDSAVEAGVSPEVILELSETLEAHVDFKRDFAGGEEISLRYEEAIYTYDGQRKRIPRAINAASVQTSKGLFEVNRIGEGSEQKLVISKNGKIVLSLLLPVHDARLSSAFGRRKHPVLAGWMMHKGVDFAANRGDAVFAVAGGKVTRAGREGGFGRVVRIEHAGGMETIYAHLSKISAGLKPGSRVRQGDKVGEVGRSGLATSTNLHFEIRNGKESLDPLKATTLRRLDNTPAVAAQE